MKLRQSRYVPKKNRYTLLKVLDIVMLAALAVMWLGRERLGIDLPDLLIISGFLLLGAVLAAFNRRKDKELRVEDEFLEKMRDEIGKENYSDTSFFFGDDK